MFKTALQSIGIIGPSTNPNDRHARELHLRAQTANEETRSVDAVIATENPALSFNIRTGELVLEIYLADGFVKPDKGQVPLLDTHQRGSTKHMRGSIRRFRVDGAAVVGTLYLSRTASAEDDWINIRDGHLTDVSGGFRPMESTRIPAGKSAIVKGRKFVAPESRDLYVHSKWGLGEGSLACIGADVDSVIRRGLRPGEQVQQQPEQQPQPARRPEYEMGPEELARFKREVTAKEINRIVAIRDTDPGNQHPDIVRRMIDDPDGTPERAAMEILTREANARKYLGDHQPVAKRPADWQDQFRLGR